jgi:hydroxyisourate hydrolase
LNEVIVTGGKLTTHVLDTMRGRPGAGIRIELNALDAADGARRIADVVTNDDGRTDAPLLAGDAMKTGRYELLFHIGAYFRGASGNPPFLDIVPVRFAIADPAAHYHVPLLASPWSYTTYRGS